MADFRVTCYLDIIEGGYEGEDHNPTSDTAWSAEYSAGDSGSHTETYYYTDSNYVTPTYPPATLNANGSRVYFKITDEWTSQKLANNKIKIHLKTTLHSITRGGITGNPNAVASNTRRLTVTSGSYSNVWPALNIGVAETILGSQVVTERDITLEPEASRGTASVYVKNKTNGYDGPGDTDEFGAGANFKNLLKKGFSHCISYDANGGRGAPSGRCWVDEEECSSVSISSQRPWSPHWVFLGWSTNKNATTASYQPGQSITVCDSVTLYAIYRYTYRPGMVRHDGTFYSCDRDGASGPLGCCNVRRGNKWIEMRIDPVNSGLADPPCIEQNGAWRIQRLIGEDGTPHHIKWDCPHEWT